jgi:hypothetical protein
VPEAGGTFAVTGGYTYLRPGSYPVTVSIDGPDGSLGVVTTAVVSRSAPQVSSVTNPWGPTQGGAAVSIAGANLFDATAVRFGSTAAAAFQVNADGTITAVAPALAAGSYDVTVTTPYGTSSTSTADLYTATAGAAPTLTGLGTSSGPTGGGNTITINGTNLATATTVNFGSIAADFTVVSNTSLTATVPALAGTLSITFIGGYTPTSGTAFRVLTWASHSGSFATVNTPGGGLTPQYNSGDFSLLAMAEVETHQKGDPGRPGEEEKVPPAHSSAFAEAPPPPAVEATLANRDLVFAEMAGAADDQEDSLAAALEEGFFLPVAILEALIEVVA